MPPDHSRNKRRFERGSRFEAGDAGGSPTFAEPGAGPTKQPFLRFFRRPPRQSRSRALVDAILTALEDRLGSEPDADGWTIEGVLERAGVGVGSFYEYFATKDSMLGALVGALTERNFVTLLAVVDASLDRSLEETLRIVGDEVAKTYLGRPRTTRTVIAAIGRLGLMHPVQTARDRFAGELASRAQRFLPDCDEEDLAETFRVHADATMGVIAAELLRNSNPDVHLWGERIATSCLVMLRARHGASVQRAEPEAESP